ncbi:uncharacterized protein LOC132549803 [Ylistrum balloti]|uniref:uncharacterized protein LOC132549803 n=1 Tax=Ylistrum balloti TaxID=509963 RepID=UPI00290580C7|nr:uncharacterized protein LOC132549803 [Ylistrum balloti]
MNYCPEIAVLQSALLLTNKQIGIKGKVKTSKTDVGLCVSILHGAIQEICSGLEEDREQQEEETWSRHLYNILLYKVITTHYKELHPEEDRGLSPGKLVDKIEALCSVLPPVNKTVFIEVVKRCGWFQLFFDSLISIQEQVARSLLYDTVSHICEDQIDGDDLLWGKLFVDYFVSILITSLRPDESSYNNKDKTSQSESIQDVTMSTRSERSNEVELSNTNGDIGMTGGLDEICNSGNTIASAFTLTEMCYAFKQIMMVDRQKAEKIKDHGNEERTLSELCQWLILGICFCPKSPEMFSQISEWMKFNSFGIDIEDDSRVPNLPSKAFGRYSSTIVLESDTGLNSTLRDAPSSKFPWKRWVDEIKTIVSSETVLNVSKDKDKNLQVDATVSLCNYVPLVSSRLSSGKMSSSFMSLRCSLMRFLRMVVKVLTGITECSYGQNVILDPEENLSFSEDLKFIIGHLCEVLQISYSDGNKQCCFEKDWSLSAILWRIENRQPDYTDGLLKLVTTFDAEVWSNSSLIKTIQEDMAALLTTDIMEKFYELVAKIADSMDPESLWQLKQLVLAGFSSLPLTVQDEHIATVYSTYRHWPHPQGNQLDGIVTTTLNKLTMENRENEKVILELCQLALQDVELVIKGIVSRASSSAQQAEIAIKVLTRMSNMASGKTEGCSVCDNFHQFILCNKLSPKERRNALYFIQMAIQKPFNSEDIMRTPLLNCNKFIQKTVLPFLNVSSLSNQNQGMDTIFALEIFISIIEAMKHHKAFLTSLVRSLATESAPWLLSVAELWQHSVALWESDEDAGVRLKLKENLVKFSALLKLMNASGELCTYGPETSVWLHSHLEQLDWSVQLHMAEILGPVTYTQECELEELCLALINNSGDRVYLDLLRAAAVSEPMMHSVAQMFTKADSGLVLVYEDMVVTLAQMLPHCVFEEWKRVTQLIQRLFDQEHPTLQHNNRYGLENFGKHSEAVLQSLNLSQLLHDVMVVLQYTTLTTNMAGLLHCTKCYVAVLKEYVLVKESTLSASEHLLLLTEVFCHVCNATYWMPMETLDPLDVLQLDMVCSLELVKRELDMNAFTTLFTHSIKHVTQNLQTVQNADTKSMLDKKITALLQ